MKKRISLILILCLVIISQTGCTANNQSTAETSFGEDWLLNTYCYIKIYEAGREDLISDAFQYARGYENKLSRTIAASEISTGEYSDETKALVDRALAYEEESGGRFCIHLGSVSALWPFDGSENPKVPDADAIADGLAAQTVDLGAIAKGYIADKTADYLRENGVDAAIISLGGNIYLVGEKPDKDAWQVGIEKPFSDNGQALETREQVGLVSVGADCSVVTSGIYERCFTGEDGKFYHHILDPKTGYPAESDLASATVIGPSSCDCDALATSAILMGSAEGAEFITNHGYEYVFIKADGSILSSPGANFAKQ